VGQADSVRDKHVFQYTVFAAEMAAWSSLCPHTIYNQFIWFVVAIKYLYRSLS